MRITRIDIENFGKLNNFHLQLDTNPVILLQDNGWGKSTLAAFIRVMFFGFMDEGKRKVTERERLIMKPWNNGVYGGSVSFEVNGRQYRLERTFGTKISEDKGRLVDITTKIACNDYDIDIIGEQLFGINADAYIRTIFVGQNNLEVRNDKDGIDDSITAKIGNLTEATDDINNYDNVIDRLKMLSNSIKSGNKKGEINVLLEQKDRIVRKLNTEDSIAANIQKLSAQIEDIADSLEKDRNQMIKLDEEYEKAGRLEAVKTNYDNQLQLMHDLEECREKLKEQSSIFEKRIPDSEEVEKMILTINEATALKEKCQSLSKMLDRSGQEISISNNRPEGTTVENILSTISKRQDCIANLKEAEIKYEHEQEVFQIRKDMLDMEFRHRQEEYEKQLQEHVRRVKAVATMSYLIAGMISVAAIAGAVVGFLVTKRLLLFVIAAIIIVIAIAIVIIASINSKKKFGTAIPPNRNQKDSYDDEERQLERITELIQVHRDKIDTCSKAIQAFCEKYHFKDDEALENNLHILLGKISAQNNAGEMDKEYNNSCKRLEELAENIKSWFESISSVPVNEWFDTALRYKLGLNSIEQITGQINSLLTKLANYEKYEQEYSNLRETKTVAEIIKLKNELDDRIDNSKILIETLSRQLEELQNLQAEIENEKENLTIIDEKLKENQHKYDIINKTMGYLNKAKEQLSSRYMDPIGDAFAKYYSFITTEYIDAYEVDADIRLTRQELGMGRDSSSLSKGYKDLVDVALRMALIEVMYGGEKPWIIFDDPFVNLDSEKLGQVRNFLKEVSKEYQVIYFTCHESRA